MTPRVGSVVHWKPRECNVRVTAVGLRCVFLVPLVTGAVNGRCIVATVREFERDALPCQLVLAL